MIRFAAVFALFLIASISESSASTWKTCAVEGSLCAPPYPTTVRYGANGAYKFKATSGPIMCNNPVFGDPLFNVKKSCAFEVRGPAAPSQEVNSMGRRITGSCANSYRNWQRMHGARAFAITDDGRQCGWSFNKRNVGEAQSAAMNACRARFLKNCTVTESSP